MDLVAAHTEMRRLSALVDKGVEMLGTLVHEYADAEHDYRRALGEAWVVAPRDHEDRRIPVSEREAWVQAHTAEARKRRDTAEGLRQTALEAVRSRRAQLSAWQSLLAAHREDLGHGRYGPEVSP